MGNDHVQRWVGGGRAGLAAEAADRVQLKAVTDASMELQPPTVAPQAAILRPLVTARHKTTAKDLIYAFDGGGRSAMDDRPPAGRQLRHQFVVK